MGIIYSGQTITNSIIDGSTASAVSTNVRNALINVGWTVVTDGSSTGVYRLRSVATPQGLQGDLWTRPVGKNTVFNASSVNAANYNTANMAMPDATLIPGTGFSYQIIASPYYFYLFRLVTPCPTQQSFMFMVPYIPPFLTGLIYESVLAQYGLDPNELTHASGLFAANTTYSQLNGSGAGGSGLGLWNIFGLSTNAKPTWFDGSCEFYEPRVMSYQASLGFRSGPLQAIGYLWDALVVNYAMPRGTIIPYDGGSWFVLTESSDPGLMLKVA
jgi:hypothetical protein